MVGSPGLNTDDDGSGEDRTPARLIEARPGMWCNRPRQRVTVELGNGSKVSGIIRSWRGDRRVEIEPSAGQRITGTML